MVIQNDLRSTVAQRSACTDRRREILGTTTLGSGSAYGRSLQNIERSNTELPMHNGQADRRKMRALKSGNIPHLKTNA